MSAVPAAQADPLTLERQVCFALAVTNRAVLAVYRPLLEPLGLTHPQYLVMLALWDHHKKAPGAALSVKQIAGLLQLDSATLSPMLKRLAALGLVSRSRSVTDERATEVRLTDAGVALRERALGIPAAVTERMGVDTEELEQLHQVLTRVNKTALAAGALKPCTRTKES